MLHWTPARTAQVAPIGFNLPKAPASTAGFTRSEHARMLAHAAKRRLSARGGDDAGYWKACAPAAVAKAARIRGEGLCRLP